MGRSEGGAVVVGAIAGVFGVRVDGSTRILVDEMIEFVLGGC